LHGIFSFLSKELKTTLLTLMFLWGRKRVLVHGILHYGGYKDKGEAEEL
jgi:ssRNA-specific RNase YbeY (16S rRNA maturation enzyme)